MRINPFYYVIALLFAIATTCGAENWFFSSVSVTSFQREDNPLTILDGNAKVESDNLTITADHLELSGSDYDIITGRGNLVIIDIEKDLRIQANTFEYDRTAKIMRFKGMVDMVDTKENIVIRCGYLEYSEEDDSIVMQATVRIIKDSTVGRGEFAIYSRVEEILELSGKPKVWKDDNSYNADYITFNMDTNEIVLEGAVEGALVLEEEE